MRDLLRLARLIRPYWGWMALGALLGLLVVLANMALLALSGWFIAAMAAAGAAGAMMNYLTPAAGIRFFAIVRTGGRYLERLVTHEATLRFLSGLRVWFYERLEPLAPARLQQYRSGDILSRIRGDIDTLDNAYLRVLVPMAVAALGTVVSFVFLALFSWEAAWLVLAALAAVGIALPLLAQRLSRGPGRRAVAYAADVRAAVVDGVQGLAELTVFGAAAANRSQVGRLTDCWLDEQRRLSDLRGSAEALSGLLTNLTVWGVTLMAVPIVRSGQIAPANLATMVLFTLGCFECVAALPAAYLALGETLAAARRIFDIVDAPAPVPEPEGPSPAPRSFGIRFEDVFLRYGADRPWALDGVSLVVPEGARIAVIGASGSGKTSLLNALLRFWDFQGGEIALGERSIREYHAEDLRRHLAVISQNTHLFNTTVRENLRIANPSASDDMLRSAIEQAQIAGEMDRLPRGLDTYVGEGGFKLSGGQARRLAVARALLKDAPILILDEPTEGLDAATERSLMEDLRAGPMRNRTVLLITHRLVGLEHMDRILVMETGRVVESGTHAELLARHGRYRRLRESLEQLTRLAEEV